MADRSVLVRLKADISDFNRGMLAASAGAKTFTASLDTSTDRMTNLTQSALALGPALVPLSAVAVPAISGLTNQLAFATAGAGVAALAFSGVGDALKATNDYALEPSAANFEKMQETLATLGPSGQRFVGFLQELRPEMQRLQDAAQDGLFPGVESGLTDLMDLLPNAERIISQIATGMGQVIAEAGDNLNDPRWQEFFAFLEHEAKPTLVTMGRTLGNFAEGFANLWMAFDPLSDQFSKSFLDMSRDFAKWTDGLSQTEGFQDFVAYIQENGPKAFDALSSLGNAFLQIVEAAAPVGAAVLPVIEAVGDAIATIADSDLGPVIIGIVSLTSAYARLLVLSQKVNSSAIGGMFGKSSFGGAARAAKDIGPATRAYLDYGAALGSAGAKTAGFATTTQRLGASLKGTAKLAGGAGGLAFIMSDLDDKMGLTNTAMGAMIGSTIGPWGTAIGAAAGLAIDLTHQVDDAGESVKRFQQAFAGAGSLKDQEAVISAFKDQIKMFEDVDAGFLQDDIEKLKTGLEPLEKQHEADARAADDARFAEFGLSNAMRDASDSARAETIALLDNIRTKNEAADAAENAFSAETNYRRALKDAQAQAKKTNAGIEGSSDAALKNREALDTLAGAWNRVADAGGKTSADMKKAKSNFIQAAIGMGVSRTAAKRLADELFHIPSPKPKVTVTGETQAKIAAWRIRTAIASIRGKSVNVYVNTIKRAIGGAFADGGYITGPGGPRDDQVPILASNGEFIVNAAATAKNLGLLQQINAQKFADGGRVQRMADGGSVRPAATPDVNVSGGMTPGQFKRALKEVLPGVSVRIVGKPGNQRLEIMGG